jgi:hypothetical protein
MALVLVKTDFEGRAATLLVSSVMIIPFIGGLSLEAMFFLRG